MKIKLVFIVALVIAMGGYGVAADGLDRSIAPAPMVQAEPEMKAGEVLVKFEASLSSQMIETTNRDLGASVIEAIPEINLYRLRIPEKTTIAEMIERYQHTAGVAHASPNYIVHALETPNDPRFNEQWALSKIEAPAAWDITTGMNEIVIAVIDTGIDYRHPDLDDGRYIGGYDFVNGDGDPMDDEGHGTHVTGIATADTNNGLGIAGLAWNSQFMAIKVLNAEGMGNSFDVIEGIRHAANHGADVVNLSLGAEFDDPNLEEAIRYAYEKGVVMACAAGNGSGPGVVYPAAYEQCLAVAATTRNDERAYFSSYGPEVDVAAPGVSILSTTGSGYASWSGTSMAAPHVAGLAALILAQDSDLSVDQVFAAIRNSADDVNASTHPGVDDYLGTGRINAYRALAAAARLEPLERTAGLNSSFDVDVVIEGIVDLGSFQFEMAYDPSVVTVAGVSLGPFLGSTGRTVSETGPDIDNGIGAISYGARSAGANPGPDGGGVLATITFDAVGLGSSVLHLEHMTATHTSENEIPVVMQDGYVTVADAFIRLEPPDKTVRIGSPFTMTVLVSDVTDLGSFQFDLTYDSRVVTATDAACDSFLGSTGRSVVPMSPSFGTDSITFGCSSTGSAPGPNGTGTLATIFFSAVDLGSSPLQFENVQMTDTTGSTITALPLHGSVTVTTPCREDVNGDGVVNIVDIQLVAAHWNTVEGEDGYDPLYDINDDHRINIIDVQLVSAKWNTTC